MSNYINNPVGFLQERYQSCGKCPMYEVVMVSGEAHSPLFQACLTVPQGYSVTSTGSSKKMAKNKAARLMLEKLEEVEGLNLNKCVPNSKNVNVNVEKSCMKNIGDNNMSTGYPTGEILVQSPKTVKATSESNRSPVFDFFCELFNKGGSRPRLSHLMEWDPTLGNNEEDSCSILEMLAEEQGFEVIYCSMVETKERTLMMVQMCGVSSHILCLGEAPDETQARHTAARTALVYTRTMVKNIMKVEQIKA